MAKCPICNVEHQMPLSPRTGEPNLSTCLKNVSTRVEAIEALIENAGGPPDEVEADDVPPSTGTIAEEQSAAPPEVIALAPVEVVVEVAPVDASATEPTPSEPAAS